jgi:hypothetical protein
MFSQPIQTSFQPASAFAGSIYGGVGSNLQRDANLISQSRSPFKQV